MKAIQIADRIIGKDGPPFIIAEMSANHNGSLDKALAIVDTVSLAGADAIKLQTYTADTLTLDKKEGEFLIDDIDSPWYGKTLHDLYQLAHTPWEWHEPIMQRAKEKGLICFSSPFDVTSVDFLEKLNVPAYKIASFELTDLPLIKYVAQTGKPMIMSTGMADLAAISEAVETAQSAGCEDLILLHCVSAYPTPLEQANVRTVPDLSERFHVITGLSDHTLGVSASLAAVALGAQVIEKHVTLSRLDKGPDSAFSIEPDELETLCHEAKKLWASLGTAGYAFKASEKSNIRFRRSLYVVQDIDVGESFTQKNIRSIRPGFGLPPKYFDELIGKKAACPIKRGTALSWDLVEKV